MAYTKPGSRTRGGACLLAVVLLAHAGLLAWVGLRNAPAVDEASHLAAGVHVWHFGRFDLYPVNPPLVRTVAALPVVCCRPETDWSVFCERRADGSPGCRPEWSVGIGFVRKNVKKATWYFGWARWACIPLSLIGGYFCWRWAGELYGEWAGAMAVVMWCASPNVLAWSATICPDAAAAALGVAAGYFFWRWLREPDWANALTAGIALGLALLTKMTWILLFAAWPLVWVIWIGSRRRGVVHVAGRKQALRLVGVLAVGVFVLNLGYGFEGTFTRLGEFTFASRSLAAADSTVDDGRGGNRFAESWLAEAPVPLPRNYVQGTDLQKVDFERGLPSYLLGQWQDRGWWYYYVACAVLKAPLGTWALALLALAVSLGGAGTLGRMNAEPRSEEPAPPGNRVAWTDELALLLPAVVLFCFVSSQTGFSHHFRYVLPACPFLFIWISRVACVAVARPRTVGVLTTSALAWSVASSLWIYPHSMSYFNELAGGPRNGHRYLIGSNLDWGQDVLHLKEWSAKHPQAEPLNLLPKNAFCVDLLGRRDWEQRPMVPEAGSQRRVTRDGHAPGFEPQPGWYAASIHRIHNRSGEYRYFLDFKPVATAGYGIYIYHITRAEANRVRGELGLPELSEDWEKAAQNHDR